MKPQLLGFILCSLLFILPWAGVDALVSSEKFPVILQETKDKVDDIRTYSAEEVYVIVKKNLDRMITLRAVIDSKKADTNEKAKKITSLLKEMRDDYMEIASMRNRIENGMAKKIQELKELLRDPQSAIQEIEKEKAELAKELDSVPATETDSIRRTIREQSLKAQISIIEGELSTWRSFSTRQFEMTKKTEEMTQEVSNFMLALSENARVYDKAYRFALVNEQYNEAIKYLYETSDKITEMTNKLMQSWSDLQKAIDEAVRQLDDVGKKPAG